jgi:hypothetical protein
VPLLHSISHRPARPLLPQLLGKAPAAVPSPALHRIKITDVPPGGTQRVPPRPAAPALSSRGAADVTGNPALQAVLEGLLNSLPA